MAKSLQGTVFSFIRYIWLVIVQLFLVLGQIFLVAWPILLLLLGLLFLGRWTCSSATLVISFLDTLFNGFITIYNAIAIGLNALSLILPVIFTIWNRIIDIIYGLINYLGAEYCVVWPANDLLNDCSLPASLLQFLWDILCYLVDVVTLPFGLGTVLLNAFSAVVCDSAIANEIGYTLPAVCPIINIKDIIQWLIALLYYFIGLLPSFYDNFKLFLETYSGEFGLSAIMSFTPPHNIAINLPSTTGFLSMLFRFFVIPEVAANIVVGLFLNTFIAIPDLLLCSLGLTVPPGVFNFIGCILLGGGNSATSPCFQLLSAIPVPLPIIGQVTIDLSAICSILPAICPCFRCINPWIGPTIRVPCAIGSLLQTDCATCVSGDTIFNFIGAVFCILFPSICPTGIENKTFI